MNAQTSVEAINAQLESMKKESTVFMHAVMTTRRASLAFPLRFGMRSEMNMAYSAMPKLAVTIDGSMPEARIPIRPPSCQLDQVRVTMPR